LAEKVNDEKNLEADMVGLKKGLEARPKPPRLVIAGASSR
jgi:hypothetical protein